MLVYQGFDNVQYNLTGLGHLLVLCLRKIRVLLAFFVTASIWWFQDSLLLIFLPSCFAVLCSRSPGWVAMSMSNFLFLRFRVVVYG